MRRRDCGVGCLTHPALERWASPRRLLAFLCALNLLFFLDRGVVASNGVNGSATDDGTEGLSTTFDLSLFEDGLVAALYFVGVMLGAPIFAVLSKRHTALRLLGWGTALFGGAALLCGFSYFFAMVLVFRCLVGAGSASLIALGPPLVDDHAPDASRSLWLGLFYLTMPTGVALGYLLGGAIGSALSWRAAFWMEAGLAAPFSLWCLLAPTVDIKHGSGTGPTTDQRPSAPLSISCSDGSTGNSSASKPPELAGADARGQGDPALPVARPRRWVSQLATAAGAVWTDLRLLARHPVCLLVIAALTCWNGFIGAYGYWGPKAVTELFSISPEDADFVFGAVLAAAGILGSLAGGILLDLLGATMPRGMLLGAAGLGAGCVLAVLAVTLPRSQAAFWPLFASAEFAVFLVMAPANAVCMWSVPGSLRPFALSVSELMQHLLGDIPTPPAMGALQSAVDDWRLSLALFALLLALGAAVFLAGALMARPGHARDYRQDEQLLAGPGASSPQQHSALEEDHEQHELLRAAIQPASRHQTPQQEQQHELAVLEQPLPQQQVLEQPLPQHP